MNHPTQRRMNHPTTARRREVNVVFFSHFCCSFGHFVDLFGCRSLELTNILTLKNRDSACCPSAVMFLKYPVPGYNLASYLMIQAHTLLSPFEIVSSSLVRSLKCLKNMNSEGGISPTCLSRGFGALRCACQRRPMQEQQDAK